MSHSHNPIVMLVAEDDEDDQIMIKDAWEESRLPSTIFFVKDGEELIDYLRHQGRFSDKSASPKPGLILLDLNMPRKDGRQALKEIKNDPQLRCIPVVALTTSQAEEDILQTYDLGANSFISKPVSFDALVEILKNLGKYWFETVELPYSKSRDWK